MLWTCRLEVLMCEENRCAVDSVPPRGMRPLCRTQNPWMLCRRACQVADALNMSANTATSAHGSWFFSYQSLGSRNQTQKSSHPLHPFTKCTNVSPFTRPQLDSKLQIPQMPPSFKLQALEFSTRSVRWKPSFRKQCYC